MKTICAVLFCALSLAIGVTAVVAAPGAANASWNAGSKGQGNVAFWIRDKEGSCEEQKSALPLVFGTKNLKAGTSSGPLQVQDLAYCILLVSEPANKKPDGSKDDSSNCASGSVEFSYDAAANQYLGKYDITMKNKTVRRGEFRAQFCEPKEPAKKSTAK